MFVLVRVYFFLFVFCMGYKFKVVLEENILLFKIGLKVIVIENVINVVFNFVVIIVLRMIIFL